MRDRNELRDFLTGKAMGINELSPQDRDAAIVEILKYADGIPTVTGTSPFAEHHPDKPISGFGIHHEKIGTVSIKGHNYFISWTKILLGSSSVPLDYFHETLSAMTLLTFLVTGAVHRFDQIDAEILAVIHRNATLLPLDSATFYDMIAKDLPLEINRHLFMKRLVTLATCGTVSLDNDLLAITETIVRLGSQD